MRWTMIILILFSSNVLAVHNLTANGEEETTITVGDSVNISFEYESTGNSAACEIVLTTESFDLPLVSTDGEQLEDGGTIDETGVDGVFSRTLTNFFSGPADFSLIVTMTDEGISDEVIVHFEPLASGSSISGKVEREDPNLPDLPVAEAFIYVFYNVALEELISIYEEFDLEAFLEYIGESRYVLTGLTGLTGNYEITVPAETAGVPCLVGVKSTADLSGNYVSPPLRTVVVDGDQSGVDFLYQLPDGQFQGLVKNTSGEPIWNAFILLFSGDSYAETRAFVTDSLGTFSIALLNGSYHYDVTKLGYVPHTDSLVIDDNDVYREIILEAADISGDPVIVHDALGLGITVFPCPFSRTVSIGFLLGRSMRTRVAIYDLEGQCVVTLSDRVEAGGMQEMLWDGTDSSGSRAASGTYLCTITTDHGLKTHRIMLLR